MGLKEEKEEEQTRHANTNHTKMIRACIYIRTDYSAISEEKETHPGDKLNGDEYFIGYFYMFGKYLES